jgi:hypothetical protein
MAFLIITEATSWPTVPDLDDDVDCGAVIGMNGWHGTSNTRRKHVPVALYLPQIPHGLVRARNCTAAVGNRLLTVCYGMANLADKLLIYHFGIPEEKLGEHILILRLTHCMSTSGQFIPIVCEICYSSRMASSGMLRRVALV